MRPSSPGTASHACLPECIQLSASAACPPTRMCECGEFLDRNHLKYGVATHAHARRWIGSTRAELHAFWAGVPVTGLGSMLAEDAPTHTTPVRPRGHVAACVCKPMCVCPSSTRVHGNRGLLALHSCRRARPFPCSTHMHRNKGVTHPSAGERAPARVTAGGAALGVAGILDGSGGDGSGEGVVRGDAGAEVAVAINAVSAVLRPVAAAPAVPVRLHTARPLRIRPCRTRPHKRCASTLYS